MNKEQQLELQRRHKEETGRMMRRILIIGSVKLAVLSVISAVFVYWYMYS